MYRLRVGVNLCSGLADAGERREIEGETTNVSAGDILLDGGLGELQSTHKLVQHACKFISSEENKPLVVVACNNDEVGMFRNDAGGLKTDPVQRRARDQNYELLDSILSVIRREDTIFALDFLCECGGHLVGGCGE
jgi:hypothetical protein